LDAGAETSSAPVEALSHRLKPVPRNLIQENSGADGPERLPLTWYTG